MEEIKLYDPKKIKLENDGLVELKQDIERPTNDLIEISFDDDLEELVDIPEQQFVYGPGPVTPQQDVYGPGPVSPVPQQVVYGPGPTIDPQQVVYGPGPTIDPQQVVYGPGPTSPVPQQAVYGPGPVLTEEPQFVYGPGPTTPETPQFVYGPGPQFSQPNEKQFDNMTMYGAPGSEMYKKNIAQAIKDGKLDAKYASLAGEYYQE